MLATIILKGPSPIAGAGMCSRIASRSGRRSPEVALGSRAREPEPSRAVEHGEVEVVVQGGERKEEVADLLLHFERPRVRPVDLVDQDDRPLLPLDRLLQHESRLGQRALRGVHQKQNALDHRQDAFDLRAEVAVPRRVDDVDDGVAISNRRVLGEDGDPALFLEVPGVHDELRDLLADAEGPALLQERVDERRLSVVDVRHDGQTAPVFADAGEGDGRRFHAFSHILG